MATRTAFQWFQELAQRQRQGADSLRLAQDVTHQLNEWKTQGDLEVLIRKMLALVGLDRLLPIQYVRFKPLLMQGMTFVLAQLPLERLARKILDQAALGHGCSSGERICTLINDMPTLQKLGQILARDPGLDKEFRRGLTHLEDNIHSVTFGELRPHIHTALRASAGGSTIFPETRLLAEATVCAVVGATARQSDGADPEAVVLKMVKPAVEKNLARELAILDDLARFLDDNAPRWGLGAFRFQETFEQVRWCLENEVDLSAEQKNLRDAGAYFKDHGLLRVPRALNDSTARMTIMSREEGHKITAVDHLDRSQRRALAMVVARTLILEPITSLAPSSIFHGDPHAGNIAYEFKGDQPHLILYDWGMMGRLSPMDRFALVLMALGIAAQSTLVIVFAADLIAKGEISADQSLSAALTRDIDGLLARREHRFTDILATLEAVFENLTRQGISLPLNLMMYKKAQVTLKGVLAAIDPGFARDDYLIWAAATTFVRDFAHFRYQRMVMAAAWNLHQQSLGRVLRLQKQLLILFRETGLWLLSMPFALLEETRAGVQAAIVPIRAHSPRNPRAPSHS